MRRARSGGGWRAACAIAASTAVVSGASAEHAIPRQPSPGEARVYFITPSDEDTVSSPVTIRFGLSGMGVSPAGNPHSHAGHHHLIIDAPLPDLDAPLPADERHRHFGGGQTEVTLELSPGNHTLQLVLGDGNHVPHDPPVVSERITIRVK